MPELPEVENIGRALKKLLTERTILKTEIFTPALRTPLAPLKDEALKGQRSLMCAAGDVISQQN